MPNVEMIDSALQSADGPKTFDELVPLLEDAGRSEERGVGEESGTGGSEWRSECTRV